MSGASMLRLVSDFVSCLELLGLCTTALGQYDLKNGIGMTLDNFTLMSIVKLRLQLR